MTDKPDRTVATPWARLRSALFLATLLAVLGAADVSAQDVAIVDFSVDPMGRAQITVESSPEYYYVLHVRHDAQSGDEEAVSMALGEEGTTTLTESLAAYPEEQYRVAQLSRSDPGDLDHDRRDDVAEFEDLGLLSPLNPARKIPKYHGTVAIPDRARFQALSYKGTNVLNDKHLRDLEYVKFYLLNMDADDPKLYFINTQRHRAHGLFAHAIGISQGSPPGGESPSTMLGEIVFHPHVLAPNRTMGVYRFEFEPNDGFAFQHVQRAHELIAKNMPFLRNNLAYYPMPNAALPRYEREKSLYDASRVAIILDEDILVDTSYIPFNLAEGFGMLNIVDLDERPHPRDVVLYGALPNELSRVAGIITTVPQTPLSHVNLRAIQDGVPNAYIEDALDDRHISSLVGKHVYYRAGEKEYEIREATLEEVDAFYEEQRPTRPQIPLRDLRTTAIAQLDDVRFEQWTSYGVKAANVATMRAFGFPEGTIRDGFAVPFYFYDEFMKHNGFYDEVQALLDEPGFQDDYSVQEAKLKDLRKDIKDADMPEWMLDDLADMHASFAPATSIRCRSSTNNEDLPGFSGAGLYDSYTQHPDEGHIAKSIKQVYASLWNFRAFDERQFHRIDHLSTAMGVLVHRNFEDEKANGVGVTTDPIYQSNGTYYLNTQVGENLVTNPKAHSIPEEILLGATDGSGYAIVRPSNQVADGVQIMSETYLDQMRRFLGVIDHEFRELYGVGSAGAFAMEIEYKITTDDVLSIKQARPWHFDEPSDYLRATPQRFAVASGTGTFSVNVFSNVDWTVEASEAWIAVQPATGSGDGTLEVSIDGNAATDERTASVIITDGTLSRIVTVEQEGAAVVSPTPTLVPTSTPGKAVGSIHLPYLIRP